jgi:multidrug resistance protein, MATE family
VSLHWFNSDCFKDWGVYLKLGIPSAAMLCFEWFAFELVSLFAGNIGVVELATYTAQFNFLQVIFQFPYGLGHTISAICGNAIGELKPLLARQYAFTALKIIAIEAILCIFAVYFFKHEISYIYTNEA